MAWRIDRKLFGFGIEETSCTWNEATSDRSTQLENSTLPDGNAGSDVTQTVAA